MWGRSTDKEKLAQWASNWENRPVMGDNPYDVPVLYTGASRWCEECREVFVEHSGCGGDHCPKCGCYGQPIPIES